MRACTLELGETSEFQLQWQLTSAPAAYRGSSACVLCMHHTAESLAPGASPAAALPPPLALGSRSWHLTPMDPSRSSTWSTLGRCFGSTCSIHVSSSTKPREALHVTRHTSHASRVNGGCCEPATIDPGRGTRRHATCQRNTLPDRVRRSVAPVAHGRESDSAQDSEVRALHHPSRAILPELALERRIAVHHRVQGAR